MANIRRCHCSPVSTKRFLMITQTCNFTSLQYYSTLFNCLVYDITPWLHGNEWDPWDVFVITEGFPPQVAKWATSSKGIHLQL